MTAAVLVSGVALAGCASPYGSGPPSRQLATWASSSSFTVSLARLRADLRRIGTPATAGAAATRTACDVLVTDALAANQQLPTPDGPLTTLLSAAYTDAAAAGRDCFHGAGGDSALASRSAGERARALAGLVRAEARFDALTSSLPGSGR